MAPVVCVKYTCVCACTCSRVLLCLGFHFGQCTNPICMSLILDDVQALGSVCVMERMSACQVEVIGQQGMGPHHTEKSSCFVQQPNRSVVSLMSTVYSGPVTPCCKGDKFRTKYNQHVGTVVNAIYRATTLLILFIHYVHSRLYLCIFCRCI